MKLECYEIRGATTWWVAATTPDASVETVRASLHPRSTLLDDVTVTPCTPARMDEVRIELTHGRGEVSLREAFAMCDGPAVIGCAATYVGRRR
jgi:hypothetical protein